MSRMLTGLLLLLSCGAYWSVRIGLTAVGVEGIPSVLLGLAAMCMVFGFAESGRRVAEGSKSG